MSLICFFFFIYSWFMILQAVRCSFKNRTKLLGLQYSGMGWGGMKMSSTNSTHVSFITFDNTSLGNGSIGKFAFRLYVYFLFCHFYDLRIQLRQTVLCLSSMMRIIYEFFLVFVFHYNFFNILSHSIIVVMPGNISIKSFLLFIILRSIGTR